MTPDSPAAQLAPVLLVDNLVKQYGSFIAVQFLNFEVYAGEIGSSKDVRIQLTKNPQSILNADELIRLSILENR
jgi:hypothetical protein